MLSYKAVSSANLSDEADCTKQCLFLLHVFMYLPFFFFKENHALGDCFNIKMATCFLLNIKIDAIVRH